MGSVVISVDAELGWGFHDLDDRPEGRLANARNGWRTFLDLCDQFQIPATWAVVGHLFLEDCDARHHDHPSSDSWFACERGRECLPRFLRFGDGLIEAIAGARVDHDIGLHTFSHVDFGASTTTPELARKELEASLHAARRFDCEPTSFVFPRNSIGHRQVLLEAGIESYRGPIPFKHSSRRAKIAQAISIARRPVLQPRIDQYGLVNIPASLYLFGFEGQARNLVEPLLGDPVVKQAKLGIDRAVETDGVFHMWLHPNNITGDAQEDRVRAVLQYLDWQRSETSLTVETMDTVARQTRSLRSSSDTTR